MKLEQAARQALEALEEIAATRYPSNWCEALHDEITALREALAEQTEQEPVAEALRLSEEAIEYARQGGKVGSGIYGKALSAIRNVLGENNGTRNLDGDSEHSGDGNSHSRSVSRTPLAEQAEQEPVGRWNWNKAKFEWLTKFDYYKHRMTPLYTRPVRTKDLTDEEIHKLVKQVRFDGMTDRTFQFARAVIAAYKEKNK